MHSQAAITETFEDVWPLIFKTVKEYCEPRELPIREIISDAHEIFVDAYLEYDYDPNMTFSTFVRNQVWFRLMDKGRKAAHRNRYHKIHTGADLNVVPDNRQRYWLLNFADGLSKDAVYVVLLAVLVPPEITDILKIRGDKYDRTYAKRKMEKEMNPSTLRSAIKEHLRDDLAWPRSRIDLTFQEIHKALKEQS